MKSLIVWFANNHVTANLMALFVVIAGLIIYPLLEKKTIPDIGVNRIEIIVGLPGAGSSQVERTVSRRIEQVLIGIDGIVDITTHAKKNVSITSIEVSPDFSLSEVLNKVRSRMAVVSLPSEATTPVVREIELMEPVMSLTLSGDTDVESLTRIAELVVGRLMLLPNVSLVYLLEPANEEFQVELSESALRKYTVTHTEIINSIRSVSIDIVGTSLSTEQGSISVIGESPVNNAQTLEDLAVRAYPDGAQVVLADVAKVNKNYLVDNRYKRLDEKNVVYIGVNRAQHEDLIKLADDVRTFVDQAQNYVPDGLELQISYDASKAVEGRLSMLKNNAISGLVLVFLILLAFMNLRLSLWISAGIPIAILGTIVALYLLGVSLNMVSLFGFILVIGIVVDDAIIIGESIYEQHERNNFGVQGSIDGTLEVYLPVMLAVLTTMIAFAPMLFMPGTEGQLISEVSLVVILALAFSLVEAFLVLPSHLVTEANRKSELFPALSRFQNRVSGALNHFLKHRYSPGLEKALYWRYTTVIAFLMVFLICLALLAFRWINVSVVSQIEGDTVTARLSMIAETPLQESEQALRKLEQAALKFKQEVNQDLGFDQVTHVAAEMNRGSTTQGTVSIFLNPAKVREITSQEIEMRLRKSFGDVPHVRSLEVSASLINMGAQIDLELTHTDVELLKAAAEELVGIFENYEGVISSWDTFAQGEQEIGFRLKEEAANMGITSIQVAAQIRQAFHKETLRIYDESGNRLPVNIGYPEEDRQSLWFFENLDIMLKDGSTVPLYTIADLHYTTSPAVIVLHNGMRSVNVRAKLEDKVSVPQIMNAAKKDFLDKLDANYPGMTWKSAGGQKRGQEVLSFLALAFPITLLAMYLLMAISLVSYWQPLMVLTVIPFGIVGALVGHVIMGVEVTIWSAVGIIAVSGVVINDTLVLVDHINRSRRRGVHILEAICSVGIVRFRPIALTSITTFGGLLPLMFADSVQAQFLVPMAISLGFGVMFATTISLIFIPCLYAVLYDVEKYLERKQFVERFENYFRVLFKSDEVTQKP